MSGRPKVVVTDFITDALDIERSILGDVADVVAYGTMNEDELIGKIEDADAVMLYHLLQLTSKTVSKLQKCKLIVRCGVGYDNVDWRLARRSRDQRW